MTRVSTCGYLDGPESDNLTAGCSGNKTFSTPQHDSLEPGSENQMSWLDVTCFKFVPKFVPSFWQGSSSPCDGTTALHQQHTQLITRDLQLCQTKRVWVRAATQRNIYCASLRRCRILLGHFNRCISVN